MVDVAPGTSPHTVVLVHGALDRGASFRRVRRRLRDHTVVIYDRRGYGHNIDVPVRAGIATQVADLAAIVGAGPAVVVGHSIGGLVALTFAARHPELVRAVGAFEPPLPWLDWWPRRSPPAASTDPAAEAERFFRSMVGDGAWERLPEATRQLRRREGPALIADLANGHGEPPFDPAALAVPVSVGRGDQTLDRHRRGTDELAHLFGLAGPVVIHGAGHGAHLSHPDSFAQFVESTLSTR